MNKYIISQDKIKQQLIDSSIQYRGYIIHEWVYLEKAIEIYISKYFTEDENKQKEIFRILLNRMSFKTKLDVLKSILFKRQEIEEGFIKVRKNSYRHMPLIEKIGEINRQRNSFAHYYLNTSDSAIKKFPNEIEFIHPIDKGIYNIYNKDKCQKLIDEIRECLKFVNELID